VGMCFTIESELNAVEKAHQKGCGLQSTSAIGAPELKSIFSGAALDCLVV